MKKTLIHVFAFIGLFSSIKLIFNLWQMQSDAFGYLENCQKVTLGMTLEEAKVVMGDFDYSNRKNRSEIWTYFTNDSVKTYYLAYPAPFAASTDSEIYFDPVTQIVTRVVCGE